MDYDLFNTSTYSVLLIISIKEINIDFDMKFDGEFLIYHIIIYNYLIGLHKTYIIEFHIITRMVK